MLIYLDSGRPQGWYQWMISICAPMMELVYMAASNTAAIRVPVRVRVGVLYATMAEQADASDFCITTRAPELETF